MNIVIIDDDKLVAVSLKTILESTGSVNVLAMGSCGEEALELYSLLKPDVLLMDIRMNGMSGIEAGERSLLGTLTQGYFILPHFLMMNTL